MEFINRIDPMSELNNRSLVLRRNARIKNTRLPADFFDVPQRHSRRASFFLRQIGTDLSNRDIQTPCFQKRQSYASGSQTPGPERKVETARVSLQKMGDDSPIKSRMVPTTLALGGVLSEHRHKAKLNMSVNINDKQLRLPKILNRALSQLNDEV